MANPANQPTPPSVAMESLEFDALAYTVPFDFNPDVAFVDFVPTLPLQPFPKVSNV
jgi:hypothetical protein